MHVGGVHLVHHHAHQDAEDQRVDAEQAAAATTNQRSPCPLSTNHSSPVGPPPADLLREQHTHEVAGPLHQPQQEQVQEGVSAHVGHIDHDLVQKIFDYLFKIYFQSF